jgi:hypothetical protein
MTRFHTCLVSLVLLMAAFAFPASAAVLDSISLPAKDPAATAKWYASNFGGKRSGSSVKFGSITVSWTKAESGQPITNPAIAHLGFAVKNTQESLAALEKAGVAVVKGLHTGPASRWAILADPNGMAVGILEVGDARGLHHVMLNAPLLSRRETLGWYQKVVGAEVENFGGSPLWTGVAANNIWIMFSDESSTDKVNVYTNASMTWRVDDVEPATEIQAKRADSEENIGEGLIVIDPCGLPVRFIEDAKAANTVKSDGKLATSGEIAVSDEQYKLIAEHEGEFTMEVIRVLGQDDCTLGQFFVNGVAIAYVLELPWKNNKPMISSIPPGRYETSIRYDTKKRLRLHVDGVPGRSGIQMHIGTTPEDTQGCVLIGTGVSAVQCTLTDTRGAADRLRKAYFGTDNPKKLVEDKDRPAILIISDSITTSTEAAADAQE